MTNTVDAVDAWTMTPAEATAKLQEMNAAMHPAPPIAPATAQDARARLDVLNSDAEFAARLFNGDVATRKMFDELVIASAGGDAVADAIAGTEPPAMPIFETTQGGELPRRHVAALVADYRSLGISEGAIDEMVRGAPVTRAVRAAVEVFRNTRDADWQKRLLSGDPITRRELSLMSYLLSAPIADA